MNGGGAAQSAKTKAGQKTGNIREKTRIFFQIIYFRENLLFSFSFFFFYSNNEGFPMAGTDARENRRRLAAGRRVCVFYMVGVVSLVQRWRVSAAGGGGASCSAVRYELPCCAAAVSVVVYTVVVVVVVVVVGSVRRRRRRVPVRSRPPSVRLVRATAAALGHALFLLRRRNEIPHSLPTGGPDHLTGRVHTAASERDGIVYYNRVSPTTTRARHPFRAGKTSTRLDTSNFTIVSVF